MRKSTWSPPIASSDAEHTTYLVMDNVTEQGKVWREADAKFNDLETVIQDLLEGQYTNPVCVVSFNVAEGWSRDVSAEVALEIRQRCDLQLRDVPFFLQAFVDRYQGRFHDVQLPLPIWSS